MAAPRRHSGQLTRARNHKKRLRRFLGARDVYLHWRDVRLMGVYLLAAIGAGFWIALGKDTVEGELVPMARAAFCVVALLVVVAGLLEKRAYRELKRGLGCKMPGRGR